MKRELVIVIDFGGQYNQLVARRVRECNVYCEIYSYKTDLEKIKEMNPKGIILTGGPNSCYEEGAPTCSKELFEMHTKDASFLKVLDGGIVSYQVKEIKPGRRIYELLLEKYDLKAEECLFFDDRADNVEAARNMGIEAIQVTSREMLNEILDKMLSE